MAKGRGLLFSSLPLRSILILISHRVHQRTPPPKSIEKIDSWSYSVDQLLQAVPFFFLKRVGVDGSSIDQGSSLLCKTSFGRVRKCPEISLRHGGFMRSSDARSDQDAPICTHTQFQLPHSLPEIHALQQPTTTSTANQCCAERELSRPVMAPPHLQICGLNA